MRTSTSIYRNAGDLDAAFALLAADKAVEPANKEVVRKFVNTWLARGFTRTRAVKLVYILRKLAGVLRKPFQDATREDLISMVGEFEGLDLAESTKYDHKVVLKTFYRWFKGGEDEQTPREVAWLKPRVKNRSHKLPEDLLSEEEVLRMAQTANTPRDKALVLVLYESGCRIGELLTLKIKNINFDQYGAILRVTGKTGDRRVRIISSAPALSAWLEIYEGTKDPEAFLWPPRSNNNHDTHYPAVHASVHKLLEKLALAAGIKKRIHAHLFRHSRATALANKLTEAQMKEYFGWTQSSKMASVYVHLSGRNMDNALLELQGFSAREDTKEEQMKVVFCKRCHEKNSPSMKFCARCGSPFNQMLVSDEYGNRSNELMNELFQDPEVKEFFARKVVERGLVDKLVV
ncbi:MAG: tyrosine-type recombinase/integrase [Candidatus Micrarchaeia archaeon]|jgi:integrase